MIIKGTIQDISGDIGPLYKDEEQSKNSMFSYNRPAYNFWQGFYDGLRKKGLTHEQAMEELMSKGVRHMLDANDGRLQKLGRAMAKKYKPCCLK